MLDQEIFSIHSASRILNVINKPSIQFCTLAELYLSIAVISVIHHVIITSIITISCIVRTETEYIHLKDNVYRRISV